MAVFADTALSGEGWTPAEEIHVVGFDESASGMTVIAAAPGANKRNVLVGYFLVGEGNVGYRFQDDGDELCGFIDMAANIVHNPHASGRDPLLAAAENKQLIFNQNEAVAIRGWVKYAIQNKVS